MERGGHDDLLKLGGVYSSMWKQQQESLDMEGVAHPNPLSGESKF